MHPASHSTSTPSLTAGNAREPKHARVQTAGIGSDVSRMRVSAGGGTRRRWARWWTRWRRPWRGWSWRRRPSSRVGVPRHRYASPRASPPRAHTSSTSGPRQAEHSAAASKSHNSTSQGSHPAGNAATAAHQKNASQQAASNAAGTKPLTGTETTKSGTGKPAQARPAAAATTTQSAGQTGTKTTQTTTKNGTTGTTPATPTQTTTTGITTQNPSLSTTTATTGQASGSTGTSLSTTQTPASTGSTGATTPVSGTTQASAPLMMYGSVLPFGAGAGLSLYHGYNTHRGYYGSRSGYRGYGYRNNGMASARMARLARVVRDLNTLTVGHQRLRMIGTSCGTT